MVITIEKEKVERVYSTKEVATMWGIPRTAIFKLVREGRVRPIVGITKGFSWSGEEFANMDKKRL